MRLKSHMNAIIIMYFNNFARTEFRKYFLGSKFTVFIRIYIMLKNNIYLLGIFLLAYFGLHPGVLRGLYRMLGIELALLHARQTLFLLYYSPGPTEAKLIFFWFSQFKCHVLFIFCSSN